MNTENKIKCTDCGMSIPDMPEDATPDMLRCDRCSGHFEQTTQKRYYVLVTLPLEVEATDIEAAEVEAVRLINEGCYETDIRFCYDYQCNIKEIHECGECGERFDSEENAEKCCKEESE